MLPIRRLTFRQIKLALGISAAILAGIWLTIFVLDKREQAAITADDVFTALSQGDMTRISVCLKAKPELANARDKDGQTPLHIAARRGMADTALLLVKMGADPTLRNAEGRTAINIAQDNGSAEVARTLRENTPGK
ncbi:MAG: ankyrin repeat domain-containing protein [Acidobacteriota bacterium]